MGPMSTPLAYLEHHRKTSQFPVTFLRLSLIILPLNGMCRTYAAETASSLYGTQHTYEIAQDNEYRIVGFTRCGVRSASYKRVTDLNTFKCNGNSILPPNKQDRQCTHCGAFVQTLL